MKFSNLLYVFFVALFSFSSLTIAKENDNGFLDAIEDGALPTDKLIEKYKYPVETHFTTTSDGYILRMHRIPNTSGKPIFLQHGLLDSSATYVLMGPSLSLGYYLADLGYDVWMGNARGNRYSRNHTTLNPDTDREFWNFSWHEIGVYDIPSMIDYILTTTNSDKLYYVGHSQGTTVLFVMCSMRPEYNDKLIVAHALAPVAFMKHIQTPLLPIAQSAAKVPAFRAMGELLSSSKIFRGACVTTQQNIADLCMTFYYMIVGNDPKQFNRARFATLFGHIPAGIAVRQLLHYLQLIESDKFRQYDYGQDNMKVYGKASPPDYEVTRITAPIALHYSENDFLSEPVDVLRLSKMLPNVVDLHKMELPLWNHMDFLYAKDVRKLLYPRMHQLNKKYWIEK